MLSLPARWPTAFTGYCYFASHAHHFQSVAHYTSANYTEPDESPLFLVFMDGKNA